MSDAIRKILVPIDGSEGSIKAARFAGILARAAGATVTLLFVHDTDMYVLSGVGETAWVTSLEYDEIRTRMGEQLRETVVEPAFARATEALGALPTAPGSVVVWGHPAETICERATQDDFDLIVLGSRGRSAFTELILGSVSSQVLHHASRPVTIVR